MGNKAIQATIGGKIDNKNTNLLDKFFEIPAYQRLYEWEFTQIEELLNDMKKAWKPYILQGNESGVNVQKSIKPYFIGNITTSIDKDDDNKFILIDGQQRLTTLWFIGFYLASRECEWEKEITKMVWQNFILQNDKLRIAMPIRDKEREALEKLAKKIQKHNKEEKLEISKDLQGIHQKIIDAFGCIESWFNENFSKDDNKKEIDFERLNCFANFIYTKICFVFVELAQNTDLNRFFVRMNNRGKQLEKHEILKARILDKVKDDKSDELQKYAKIWDLCSDMNKYIFRSESDRNIFGDSKEKNDKKDNNKDKTEMIEQANDKLVHLAEIAEKYTIIKDNKKVKDNGAHSGAESIIDFPTFLLHCYKLWVVKKCNENEIPKEITITKDRLLEIIWDTKEDKNRHNYLFVKRDKHDCKDFIVDMLRYRVLFDYFVIKNTLSDDGFAIMRLDSNNQPKKKIFENLAMIQNYLRVARQGEKQNYHHWLTPFLAYLDTQKDKILVLEGNALDLDFTKWKTEKEENGIAECESKANIIAKRFSNESNDLQSDLISYLNKLDTALSKEQLGTSGENKLLPIANEAIQATFQDKSLNNINWNLKSITNEWKQYITKDNCKKWNFLNNSTKTPHYWFYRLEYYLWKNGVENEEKLEIRGKSFDKIRKNFYFRNLGSVEHFQPQSEPDAKWWLNDKIEMDTFGNLALISRSLNSSLGKQNLDKKEIDIAKEGNSESLKLVLMCCLKNLKNNDNAEKGANSKAQTHQEQMIKILIESLKDSKGN